MMRQCVTSITACEEVKLDIFGQAIHEELCTMEVSHECPLLDLQ